MKKITYFSLFLATVAHAGLFDKDLKVRIYPVCSLKDYVINWNFTVEKNSVIQTLFLKVALLTIMESSLKN